MIMQLASLLYLLCAVGGMSKHVTFGNHSHVCVCKVHFIQ